MKRTTHGRVLTIVREALLGALLFVSKLIMSGLPNIEPVSLLIIVWTRVFGVEAIGGVAVFVLLDTLMYGVSIWTVSYLYIWLILWGAVLLVPKPKKWDALGEKKKFAFSAVLWAILSGVYGFCFGAFSAIPWYFKGGMKTAIAYWTAGISFDVLHAVGNFVLALTLAVPLMTLLRKLKKRYDKQQ